MRLDTPIDYLKGIGPERAKLIKDIMRISTVEDFLHLYPIRYVDKSKIYKIKELNEELPEIQLKGKIHLLQEIKTDKTKRLAAKFTDTTGTIDLVWFKYSKWLKEQIPVNTEVLLFGKVTKFNHQFSMAHPEIEKEDKITVRKRLHPVYPSSEKLTKRGLNQRFFTTTIDSIVKKIPELINENLPNYILEQLDLMPRKEAYINIHQPLDWSHYERANRRLKFEEAFYFQLSYGLKKQKHQLKSKGNPFEIVGDYFNSFYQNNLPFDLTNAQKKVLKEIRHDMKRSTQMNRLLQGDVGSGKTIVALLSMLIAMDNGFQSCLMAPTEILAQQHFNGLSELVKDTSITIKLLTGSSTKSERAEIHSQLLEGSLHILVGTHALLEDVVKFKNLGLAIIDEQHRFGVAQRAKLWKKNTIPPHILVMTATPIPRTLAMSFYSDLDVSTIDELPLGRKPIITAHRKEKDRNYVFNFCKEEINKGRQIYFVYPLIEESETLDYKNLMSNVEHIEQYFENSKVAILHGKMHPKDKEDSMQFFASGKAQIMVATTVIEVGVNVPNASVMVIESAERFGLSQLHQLRGRVGRGGEQSYCILMTKDQISNESRIRIKTMCDTNDGFKIAEVDMQLRGPGNILGTQQSGVVDFKKLDLITDGELIEHSKRCVNDLLEKDPYLNLEQHRVVKIHYLNHFQSRTKWGNIS